MQEITNILSILSSFLGEPKNADITDRFQFQFNCPCCARDKGVDSDGKYNLEVNIKKNIYKCWVCADTDDMQGKISKLFYKYSNKRNFERYKAELESIRQQTSFNILFKDGDFANGDFKIQETKIVPPKFLKSINQSDEQAKEVINYLNERNITEKFYNRFNIRYVPITSDEYRFKERVVFLSYNKNDELNYIVSRNYNNIYKYRGVYENYGNSKQEIIFNENLINWYEDVTLVEGVFDHMVVPNSIPLLGKFINEKYILYETLFNQCKAKVNVLLDDDAIDYARKIYKSLNKMELYDRVRLLKCEKGLDPAFTYQTQGFKGIKKILQKPYKLTESEILKIF